MIGMTIVHYRVTQRLGEGGRLQCASVSYHADQDGFLGRSA